MGSRRALSTEKYMPQYQRMSDVHTYRWAYQIHASNKLTIIVHRASMKVIQVKVEYGAVLPVEICLSTKCSHHKGFCRRPPGQRAEAKRMCLLPSKTQK